MAMKDLYNDSTILDKSVLETTGFIGGLSEGQTFAGAPLFQYPSNRADAQNAFVMSTPGYQNGFIIEARAQEVFTVTNLASQRASFNKRTKVNRLVNTAAKANGLDSGFITSATSVASGSNKAVATFLMPMSRTFSITDAHNWNSNSQSKIDRSNGSMSNFISNVLSDHAASLADSITGGYLGDHGEQVYSVARNSYGGAQIRSLPLVWEVTPSNIKDLNAFLAIHAALRYLSYGVVKNSSVALKKIADFGTGLIAKGADSVTPGYAASQKSTLEELTKSAINALTNAQVTSNPTVFYIRNYQVAGTEIQNDSLIFGPCGIESITLDHAVDGQFLGLQSAPNVGSTLRLSITFRELISLTRGTL